MHAGIWLWVRTYIGTTVQGIKNKTVLEVLFSMETQETWKSIGNKLYFYGCYTVFYYSSHLYIRIFTRIQVLQTFDIWQVTVTIYYEHRINSKLDRYSNHVCDIIMSTVIPPRSCSKFANRARPLLPQPRINAISMKLENNKQHQLQNWDKTIDIKCQPWDFYMLTNSLTS